MPDEAFTEGSRVRAHACVDAELADCVACGATTVLVPTAASGGRRRLPVDPEPCAEGAFVLRDGRLWSSRPGAHGSDEPRYDSHFASCPFTARFRR